MLTTARCVFFTTHTHTHSHVRLSYSYSHNYDCCGKILGQRHPYSRLTAMHVQSPCFFFIINWSTHVDWIHDCNNGQRSQRTRRGYNYYILSRLCAKIKTKSIITDLNQFLIILISLFHMAWIYPSAALAAAAITIIQMSITHTQIHCRNYAKYVTVLHTAVYIWFYMLFIFYLCHPLLHFGAFRWRWKRRRKKELNWPGLFY